MAIVGFARARFPGATSHMAFDLHLAEVDTNNDGQNGGRNRLQQEATDSLPPKPKPGLLTNLKAKAGQVGHELEKDAKKVGKQIDHATKDLAKKAKENHVDEKVKKAAVAAGSHGFLGPAGAVAAQAIKEADKHKAKPHTDQSKNNQTPQGQKPDAAHKQDGHTTIPTHIDLTNPYNMVKKYLPKF
jgi:hypothetical protein